MSDYVSVSDYLEHYGVLGMKWGVRKNPQKAVTLANKKMKKLDEKVNKSTTKANTKVEKALSTNAKAERAILFKGIKRFKASGNSRKASRALSKVQSNTIKAKKWAEAMEKVFSKQKISNTDKEAISIAKKYADMTLQDMGASQMTINELIYSRERYKTRMNR